MSKCGRKVSSAASMIARMVPGRSRRGNLFSFAWLRSIRSLNPDFQDIQPGRSVDHYCPPLMKPGVSVRNEPRARCNLGHSISPCHPGARLVHFFLPH